MAQLKLATDKLRTQIDNVIASNRTDIVSAIEGRKTELVASPYHAKATTTAQENALRRVDQTISRVGAESEIALIREIGASFEASVYPESLDYPPPRSKEVVTTTHTAPEADRIDQDCLGGRRHRRP